MPIEAIRNCLLPPGATWVYLQFSTATPCQLELFATDRCHLVPVGTILHPLLLLCLWCPRFSTSLEEIDVLRRHKNMRAVGVRETIRGYRHNIFAAKWLGDLTEIIRHVLRTAAVVLQQTGAWPRLKRNTDTGISFLRTPLTKKMERGQTRPPPRQVLLEFCLPLARLAYFTLPCDSSDLGTVQEGSRPPTRPRSKGYSSAEPSGPGRRAPPARTGPRRLCPGLHTPARGLAASLARRAPAGTYLALRGRERLPLGGQRLAHHGDGLPGELARRPPRLAEQRVRRRGPLGLAVVLDGPPLGARQALQAGTRLVRVGHLLGRVALDPGLVGRVIGELVALGRVLESLSVPRSAIRRRHVNGKGGRRTWMSDAANVLNDWAMAAMLPVRLPAPTLFPLVCCTT